MMRAAATATAHHGNFCCGALAGGADAVTVKATDGLSTKSLSGSFSAAMRTAKMWLPAAPSAGTAMATLTLTVALGSRSTSRSLGLVDGAPSMANQPGLLPASGRM